MQHVGIDFGTTNSAVAIAPDDGRTRLLRFPGVDGSPAPLWRTVLYFEPRDGDRPEQLSAGGPAIRRYLDTDGEGRLLQSIKSYLASSSFSRTQIFGRTYTLEELIGGFLRQLRAAADIELGTRAVIGRPVRYWGAESDADEARALERMRTAVALAGFEEVVFEYEPVAAAASYADRLDHRELVLIADFGGGTSDFSLIEVGPGAADESAARILATGGVGIGGDSFDAHLVDQVVAPELGKGTSYRDEMGGEAPVPVWLFSQLRRWHHLSFLKSKKTLALLDRIQRGALDQRRIDNLVEVVVGDLGLPLHRSIEATKVALSDAEAAPLAFDRHGVRLASEVARGDFEDWIEPELARIDEVIDEVLETAGATEGAVDRVFATGGSAFVPAVRVALARRFGAGKLVGGRELTSVAWGLAERARTAFRR